MSTLSAVVGCDSTPSVGVDGGGRVDAPIAPGTDTGPLGTDAPASSCAGVTTNADGVLTNVPAVSFELASGSLEVRTFNAYVTEGPSTTSLFWWGEVENVGTTIRCTALVTMLFDGRDYLTIADLPAYQSFSSLSTGCLAPGERGVFHGIENDVLPDVLDRLSTIRYEFRTTSDPDAVAHPADPVVESAGVEDDPLGTVVAGTGRTVAPIRNLKLAFFGRDACGLVIEEWSAYPEDVEVDAPTWTFRTFARAPRPVDWILISSFITDTSPFLPDFGPRRPEVERRAELERRRIIAGSLER